MPSADELPTRVKRALEEIVRYMVSQPDAKDTAQGIHDWWLPVSNNECTLSEVEQAVENLARWGWLTEQRLADQTVVYGPSQEGLQKGVLYLKSPRTD